MAGTAVSGGAPPSVSETAIATPAVTDFGASDTSTARGAPSACARPGGPETTATSAPTKSAAAIGMILRLIGARLRVERDTRARPSPGEEGNGRIGRR